MRSDLALPIPYFLIVLLVSCGALGAALVAQFMFHLPPCILCLYQRIPYAALIVLSIVFLAWRPTAWPTQRIFFALTGLLFFASLALALFHIGVERHYWTFGSGCPVGDLDPNDTQAALAQLLATPQAPCDIIAWKFLGASITYWNAALSLALAAANLLAAKTAKRLAAQSDAQV